MDKASGSTAQVIATTADGGATGRLAQRLMEATAGPGLNPTWYDAEAKRAIAMGREFERQAGDGVENVNTTEGRTGWDKAPQRCEVAERLLVRFVAKRGSVPEPGRVMHQYVATALETATMIDESLSGALDTSKTER